MKRTWKLLPLALLMSLTAYTQKPVNAQPSCQALCATIHCTTQADCPTGMRCDFVCPGEGCCI
jgi:hypothetical protein